MEASKLVAGCSGSYKPCPNLLGYKPVGFRYRRSLTKAPRKRTFISVEMMKYSPMVQTRAYETSMGGGNGCGGNGKGLGYCGDNGHNNGDNKPCQGLMGVNPLLLAAAAAVFTVLLPFQLPDAKAASMTVRSTRRSPAELCLNHRGAGKQAKLINSSSSDIIPYGHLMLTDVEKRMISRSCQQLYCRETLRA